MENQFNVKIFFRKFFCAVILFMLIGLIKNAKGKEWIRDEIEISVGGDTTVYAELYLPKNTSPRALVIAVPGTGGLSDPYFDTMVKLREYDPDNRGGFTAALVRAGYAVVFYNQRGYLSLRKCIVGENAFERAVSFAEHCVNKNVRAQVSLSIITNDTQQVFDYFSRERRTKMLNQIAVAWSEGTYHVATLVHLKRIKPLEMVFIGGPVYSIASTMRYQFTREYFLRLINVAFANCNKNIITILDVFRCTRTRPTAAKYASLKEISRDGLLIGDVLPEKRVYFSKFFDVLVAQYDHLPSNAVMSGELLGVQLEVGWATTYFREMFAADTPVLNNLTDYSGNVLFLYGSEDELVDIPEPGACRIGSVALMNCKVKIVQYAEHGLEDGSGIVPSDVINMVVNGINAAMRKDASKDRPGIGIMSMTRF